MGCTAWSSMHVVQREEWQSSNLNPWLQSDPCISNLMLGLQCHASGKALTEAMDHKWASTFDSEVTETKYIVLFLFCLAT